MNKGTLLKNTFLNSISNIILRILQMIQGIFVANILGPAQYGIKSALQLFDYLAYYDLGALSFFYNERSKNEYINKNYVKQLSNEIFSFLLLMSIFVIIFCSILTLFIPYSLTVKLSILVIGFSVIFGSFSSFYRVILKSRSEFTILSKSYILLGVTTFLFIIIFVYLFGVLGYFLGVAIGTFTSLLYYIKKTDYSPKFNINYPIYLKIIKLGFLLFVVSLGYISLISIDKIFFV